MMEPKSVVEYFSEHNGYKCGYCKSENSCYSHGMWAYRLTPLDYMNLIDRGWRRSGHYCYKPTMNVTCCPQYTIRCDAKNFKLSKSQKKVLKHMKKFLIDDENPKLEKNNDDANFSMKETESQKAIEANNLKKSLDFSDITCKTNTNIESNVTKSSSINNPEGDIIQLLQSSSNETFPPSNNSFPNRNTSQKAKDVRKKRKLQKLINSGLSTEEALNSFKEKRVNQVKDLETYISESLSSDSLHKLELQLVPSDLKNPLFAQTFEESYKVYQKYQMIIHKDSPDKCSQKQYIRFLVNSPIQQIDSFYGSFHQHYILDGKIIAVGVLDILPYCVSSVYFYYDPDYSFLSLGTYASLREIAFTRELNKTHKDLEYYYLGFYIHSCVKMRYKGQYHPSYLLCPETYIFKKIENCLPKLDVCKYNRLEEDSNKVDVNGVVNLEEVQILFERCHMSYPLYCGINKNVNEEEVIEYAQLVGKKCYKKILLYRN